MEDLHHFLSVEGECSLTGIWTTVSAILTICVALDVYFPRVFPRGLFLELSGLRCDTTLSNVLSVSSNSRIASPVLKPTSDKLSNQPAADIYHSGAHLQVCCRMNNTFCVVAKALNRSHQSFGLSSSRHAQSIPLPLRDEQEFCSCCDATVSTLTKTPCYLD